MAENVNKELVLFYNVENLFSPDPKPNHKLDPTASGFRNWDERKYKNKLHKIANVFRLVEEKEGILPMIIGLAEINNEENLKDLVELEPFNNNYGIVHYDSLDERGVDTALLYDKRKISVLDSEAISFVFEKHHENSDNLDTTRDVLYCRLNYYNKEIINVFVLHLPSKREKDINKPKRAFILDSIGERIVKTIEKNKESVIVCGDFNENPDEENVMKLLYNDEKNKILKNQFLELFQSKKYSTFHYKDGLLFDQIILSNHFFEPNFGIHFKQAEVFNSEKISSWDKKFKGRPFRTFAGSRYLGGYSDHYPVYVILEQKKDN